MLPSNELREQSGFGLFRRLGNMTVGDMNVIRGEEGRLAGSSPDGWKTICMSGHEMRSSRRHH